MSKIFGTEIKPLIRACNLAEVPEIKYYFSKPKVNLYVMVNNLCQANCKFCTQHGKSKPFDYDKFRKVIDELRRLSDTGELYLSKVNFTGGEPLLDFHRFEKLYNIVFESFNWRELGNGNTVINTNGIGLKALTERDDIMKNIGFVSVSRHHYDDKLNAEIFQTDTLPTTEEIKNFGLKYQGKLWLRCNCIKNYIDSPEEVINYTNWAIDVGCKHCGFTSLMELNEYCKENYVYVDIPQIETLSLVTQSFKYTDDNKLCCNCNRSYYLNDEDDWCDVVTWNRNLEAESPKDGVLVFDGEYLRYGFFGEIIC